MKILVVEDDPIQRRVIRGHLQRLGYDVREVADGEQAWRLLQEENLPIVITDWLMPTLDGLSLIKRIRHAGLPSYIYMILLTSKDEQTDIVAGLDAGADDYLCKPFDTSELRARVAIGARIVDLETQLRTARDTDSLTGLRNRRALTAAENMLVRSGRTTSPLSVVMIDVDHFKKINDHYGHQVGDQALRLIATTITHTIRPNDLASRWGGEEMLVLMPETTHEQAAAVAEQIRAAIEAKALDLDTGAKLRLSASLGVASSDFERECSFDRLVQMADIALYEAKQAGRNQVAIYETAGLGQV
jgi:two-component system cell cycle response regulator